MINGALDTGKAKDYFKKKEFALASNIADKRDDPVAQFEVEKEPSEL